MFSDTYKFKLVDGVLYEVYGKLITRKVGDVQLDGANPSAEEASEDNDEAVESGVDVVLNHRLMETYAFPDKKSFTLYLKEYMKRLVDKMVENGSTEVDVFKTNINKVSLTGLFYCACGSVHIMVSLRNMLGNHLPIINYRHVMIYIGYERSAHKI